MGFISFDEAMAPPAPPKGGDTGETSGAIERKVAPEVQAERDRLAGGTLMTQYASIDEAKADAEKIRASLKNAPGDQKGILAGHLARLEQGIAQGKVAPAAKAPAAQGNFISFEEATGVPAAKVPQTMWEKAKAVFQGQGQLSADTAQSGLAQVGKEVKAATNMIVGMPGGVVSVGMDAMSRLSSLMYGDSPKVAGQKARMVADQVNEDWKKVTDTLGLSRDASGSKIDQLMNWAMEASDKGGASLEQATKGVLSLETTQSVRDTLLNALGVKGMKAIKPGANATAGALTPEAMAKGKPVVSQPLDTYAPLIETPIEPPTKADVKANQAAVDSLVVDKTRLKEIFGIAKAAGAEAEAALVKNIFDRVLQPKKVVGEAPMREPGALGPEPVQGPPAPPPRPAVLAALEKKGRGELLSAEEAKALRQGEIDVKQVTPVIGAAMEKLKDGQLISAAEATALRRLDVDVAGGVIKGPNGKVLFERGQADPRLLGVLTALGVTALAAPHIVDWWNNSGGLSGDKSGDVAMGLAAAGAAGVMKSKGGMWHVETVPRLAAPLAKSMMAPLIGENLGRATPKQVAALPESQWANRAVSNYLNKHAGTATDPIKDLKLPTGETWESLTDKAFSGTQLSEGFVPEAYPGAKLGDTVYKAEQPSQWGNIRPSTQAAQKIHDYLSHVGDYLKSQNLTPEQLQRMDLPRAIRETVANDERIQKLAYEEYTKPNPDKIANNDALPTYKTYAPKQEPARQFSFKNDKSTTHSETMAIELKPEEITYSWKELSAPSKLTPEQAKRVRPVTPERARSMYGIDNLRDSMYEALDDKGNVIRDNFSENAATDITPEGAYLAGELAREGNSMAHCVGGYCNQVLSGQSKIYSLRDQLGRSYATIEVKPDLKQFSAIDIFDNKHLDNPPQAITQIYGPGNGAPAKYVQPYIADFVKTGNWGDVANLDHAGLVKGDRGGYHTPAEYAAIKLPELQERLAHWNKLKTEGGYGREGLTMEGVDYRIKTDAAAIEALKKDLPKQAGKADPKLLAGIAAGTATALYLQQNPIDDFTKAALGLIGTVGLTKGRFADMPLKEVVETYRTATGRSKELAAAKIYESTHKQLERSVQNMGKDLPVEDIVQETYMSAFKALDKDKDAPGGYNGELAALPTFLHALAKNEMRQIYRTPAEQTARRSSQFAERAAEDGEAGTKVSEVPEKYMMEQAPEKYKSAYDESAQNEMGKVMTREIEKLPEDQKAVFKAVEIEGLPQQEVADSLGIPLGTVKSRLNRANETLRTRLSAYKDLQAGNATTHMMVKLGLISGGAVLGANLAGEEDKFKGALGGAAAGFIAAGLTHATPKGAVEAVKNAFKGDERLRIDQFADLHDSNMASAELAIHRQMIEVAKNAPKPEERAAITHAIQAGKISELPPSLQAAANTAKGFFEAAAKAGLESGVLKDQLTDYVTNLWDLTGKNKDAWEKILDSRGGPSMSPESRFALRRQITSLEVGKSLGLTPLTEDVAQIMGIYGKSLARSIENKRMLASLKNADVPGADLKMMMASDKAPHSYVGIDSPQLAGVRVHPDIAPSLKFIFDRESGGPIKQGIQAFNTAVKRSAVMGSLFHAKALLDSYVAASAVNKKLLATGAGIGAAYGVASGNDPIASGLIGAGASLMIPGMKHLAQAAAPRAFGEGIYLKQLKEGKAGDMVDKLLRSGLKVSMEKGKLADEDVGGSFYTGLSTLKNSMNKIVPHSGLPIAAIEKVNHAIDTFMWERLHTGMKLTVAAQKLEQLIQNDAKAAGKEGRAPKSEEVLAREASSFTNDIFGGLDWRRIAEDTHSKLGRDVALQAYSPSGRRTMQLALFAPDWTISTTRAALQAMPSMTDIAHPVKFVQNALRPENAKGLHAQQIARNALYYATIANGINFALSGKYIWDNEDWTTIDMGDGRKMQWSKHMMEPVHWVQKPLQQGLNKLGFFPKEVINQVMDKEYLAAGGNAPRMGYKDRGEDITSLDRIAHLGKSLSPITAQGALGGQASLGTSLSSALGVPIYGKTFEERAALKEARKALHASPEYKQLQKDKKALKKERTKP